MMGAFLTVIGVSALWEVFIEPILVRKEEK
jgi:hypothetical protein